ncbi:uncharacterized protein BJ212DRAFT_1303387 [Suillus subaureus]|uniref:DUF6533 domain-containing protein n=1 Tax=Suillus subaureus TaxID=48587 RepID=A0A9P7E086_9AGAM|nr:uncharacterized protein BJ212DRAFT_1303387 [Suillus subaureus]KAG1807678.1 hypothetical protein BJ212DRAFT_1303387 [Suillus subaureus]
MPASTETRQVSCDLEGPESISLDDINAEFARLEAICNRERMIYAEFALDWDVNGTEVLEWRAFDFAKLLLKLESGVKIYKRAMVAPTVNTGIQTAKYCNVGGLGVLIFDYFLTLEPEVQWTWNTRWNVSRVLFVISRYMAFVAAGMTSYGEQLPYYYLMLPLLHERTKMLCSRFSSASNGDQYPEHIVAAEGLLVVRTYAFWKQNKKLLAVLLVSAVISIACAVSITDVVSNLLVAPVDPSDGNLGFKAPPTSNCTFEGGRSSAIQYGFLVAFELLLMSLTVFKRYQDYRDYNSRIVRAVFQGGVRYMTAIIFVSVANILITSVVPASYDEMMDLPQLVLHIYHVGMYK